MKRQEFNQFIKIKSNPAVLNNFDQWNKKLIEILANKKTKLLKLLHCCLTTGHVNIPFLSHCTVRKQFCKSGKSDIYDSASFDKINRTHLGKTHIKQKCVF